MRLKYTKLLTMCVVATNLCLVYFTLRYFTDDPSTRNNRFSSAGIGTVDETSPARNAPKGQHDRIQSANKHIKKMVTIVFRDFFFFDTDMQASIESILNLIPSIQIVVVYDDEPYPALEFVANLTTRPNVHFVSSAFDVFRTGRTVSPLSLIRSRYTLLVPDGMRLGGRSILQKMLKEFERGGSDASLVKLKRVGNQKPAAADTETTASETWSSKMLIVPFGANNRHADSCCRMRLGFVNWTIEYTVDNGIVDCDMYTQKHGIFIETTVLKEMPDPLMTPFPEMLYVQAKVANIQETICEHEIRNIDCACQDSDDLSHFAYITKDVNLNTHYCHVFNVDGMDLATTIIMTLGQAFEVAYQMALRESALAAGTTAATTPLRSPMNGFGVTFAGSVGQNSHTNGSNGHSASVGASAGSVSSNGIKL